MADMPMRHPRRRFLQSVGIAALGIWPRRAGAQAYPTRPVRIVIGVPAGGPLDVSARLVGQRLSERLGQPFIIDNRPGAGGNIGTEAVVRAPADGHTLLLAFAANAINASLFKELNYDFIRDIAPVASINRIPIVLAVHPSFPAKTVAELIAYAKANPGKVDMATPGKGTGPHLAGELFKMMAGVDLVHVPYRGSGPMMPDLLSGQVQVAFDAASSFVEHIRAGKLRALAVATATRLEALPDIPTVGDSVPGFEASGWCGLGAPRNTPASVIERLNREVNAALADPTIKARLADVGAVVLAGSPADFGTFIADETQKWAKVVRFAGIMPE
jgi:tripartite-type tricarboxylate transporter receptor subunit TctC